ncbi:MAG: dTDP-glucose 4,6-dehydratase [Parcubacteria group bacterium Gr01-1014_70]|nr:MAG: dTDP-glucose 4,6-dehydratase [Parcubacteria group bacterium Gr01-1014_70]
MKTLVVTGCAGFIGSHLCDYLLEKDDCRIIGIDNFLTGSRENITHLLGSENFRFFEKDIIDPVSIDKDHIDQIYNLACPASPVQYQANPIRTIKVNTIGVINMLGLAKKHRARILQTSTSEVYGDPLEHPQKETYNGNVNPIGRRACYDEGKRIAEALCFEYYRSHRVDIRVARIFNTYGPRMAKNDGRVVSNFILQALSGAEITVYGDGTQTRSFCYVSDMVDGLYRLMNGDETGPVNLGNPEEITIKDIAKKIIACSDSLSKVVYKDKPEDDPHRRKPDISLAKEKIQWEPVVSLRDGLGKTIGYFRSCI